MTMPSLGTLFLLAGLIVLLAVGGFIWWKKRQPSPVVTAPIVPAVPVVETVATAAPVTAVNNAVLSFVAAEREKIDAAEAVLNNRRAAIAAAESALTKLEQT